MFDVSRNAARYFAAAAATLFLISCGGSDDTPAPPPFGATTLVIGSSLSDNGNQCQAKPSECLPTPPAYNQLDSNGPLWVNTVAARYGAAVNPSLKGGTNFAYSDARTGVVPSFGTTAPPAPVAPSLVEQTESLLARNGYTINPQNLVIVEASGAFSNSTQAALALVLANPASAATIANATVTASLTDVVFILQRLYAAGARNILLLNSGNMSTTPSARFLNNPLVTGLLAQMSAAFNSNLATQVNNLKAVSPGLNIYLVDVFTWQNEIAANPAAFGMANVTQPCLIPATATTPQVLCSTDPAVQNTYFWWDASSHPTYGTGQLLAQRALATIGR
jgi:outer membrane lipase/esterase